MCTQYDFHIYEYFYFLIKTSLKWKYMYIYIYSVCPVMGMLHAHTVLPMSKQFIAKLPRLFPEYSVF